MKKPFLRCLRAFLTATVLAAGVCFGVPGVCESPVGMRAEAVETTSDGLFEYTIQDGEVTIGKYKGTETEVVIPSVIDGCPVTKTEKTFSGSTLLTKVTIPDSVTYIGKDTFVSCYRLQGVSLPTGLKSIGNYAFQACRSITSITIPDEVTSIGEYAFNGCNGLTSIILPDSVTSVGDNAFSYCESMTSFSISGKTEMGDSILYHCEKLLPSNIVFRPSTSGKQFDYMISENGEVIITGYLGTDSRVSIPDKIDGYPVNHIGESAFKDDDQLTIIIIPSSIEDIGDYAFSDCSSLAEVACNGVKSVGKYAFYRCTNLAYVEVSENIKSIGDYAFADCENLLFVNISSDTALGVGAFSGTGFSDYYPSDIPSELSDDEYSIAESYSSIATGSVHTDTDTTTTSTQEALSTEKDTPATTELPTSANTPTATPSQDSLSDKLPAFLAAGGVIVFVGIVAAVLIIRKKKRDKQKPKMLISR